MLGMAAHLLDSCSQARDSVKHPNILTSPSTSTLPWNACIQVLKRNEHAAATTGKESDGDSEPLRMHASALRAVEGSLMMEILRLG